MNVVSVNIMGGLGNQLFQIAAAYNFSRVHGFKLEILKILNNGNRPVYWDSILKSLAPYLVTELPNFELHFHESLPTMYKPLPEDIKKNIYLHGYLQSSKYYCQDYKEEIKQLFRPRSPCLNILREKYKYLMDNRERVIVVHARRTDYLANQHLIDFHGPLDLDYYTRAIHKMANIIKSPIWLLTSDDNSFWDGVLKTRALEDVHIVNDSDEIIFALLQQFENYIISNSTFIWWAVWLSNSTNKVIAPNKWFGPTGPRQFDDIYEPEWERI